MTNHPDPRVDALSRAVAPDQPHWTYDAQHRYAHRLHGWHLAVIAIAVPETTVDWSFTVRDVLTGHVIHHDDRTGPAWALLEQLNVALSEAERKHRER